MQRQRFDLNYDQIYLDAKSYGVEEQLEDELFSFSELLNKNFEFKVFLEDPRFSADYKKECVKRICPPQISHIFMGLIFRLIDSGREDLIEELSGIITRKVSEDKGIMFGRVLSVREIPRDFRKRLEKTIKKTEGRPVRLRYDINKEILGGISIKFVDGKVLDVSLRHKLDDLRAVILK
jgi:F-type H+-transporting ATPase subunit delta